MVLKIDRSADGRCVTLRLIGRIQSEHLDQLKSEIEGSSEVVLDLQDVKLVDLTTVRFLAECEANGAELRHCSAYIREWVAKENKTSEPE